MPLPCMSLNVIIFSALSIENFFFELISVIPSFSFPLFVLLFLSPFVFSFSYLFYLSLPNLSVLLFLLLISLGIYIFISSLSLHLSLFIFPLSLSPSFFFVLPLPILLPFFFILSFCLFLYFLPFSYPASIIISDRHPLSLIVKISKQFWTVILKVTTDSAK